MRRFLLAFILACAALSAAYAQSLEEIVRIGDLSSCSMADLAVMGPGVIEAFPENPEIADRWLSAISRYGTDRPLTKARAANVAAKAIRIRSSFFFAILPIPRYAFRAMVADGVFGAGSSGGEILNGIELLDFVTALSETYGGAL